MMRRFVSSILVLMQLAQGMAFAHTHAGTGVAKPADHAQRPHFHLFGLAAHRHDHFHGHGHPHHHPHHDDDQAPAEELSPDQQAPESDHDSDAVYVADKSVSSQGSSRLNLETWQHLYLSIHTTIPRISTPRIAIPPRSLHPPFPGQYSCPVYLQTLALLI